MENPRMERTKKLLWKRLWRVFAEILKIYFHATFVWKKSAKAAAAGFASHSFLASSDWNASYTQCDKIGQFYKVLGANFLTI